jgi:hypothetical protein
MVNGSEYGSLNMSHCVIAAGRQRSKRCITMLNVHYTFSDVTNMIYNAYCLSTSTFPFSYVHGENL